MVNPVQALFGLALVFVLPGYFIVKAIFPRRRLSEDLHEVTLLFASVATSVVVTILVGAALGFLPAPEGGMGYFQGAATGRPYLEVALALVALAAAAVATARGAFPRLLRRAPQPLEPARELPDDRGALADAVTSRARAWRARRERRLGDAVADDQDAEKALRDARKREFGR